MSEGRRAGSRGVGQELNEAIGRFWSAAGGLEDLPSTRSLSAVHACCTTDVRTVLERAAAEGRPVFTTPDPAPLPPTGSEGLLLVRDAPHTAVRGGHWVADERSMLIDLDAGLTLAQAEEIGRELGWTLFGRSAPRESLAWWVDRGEPGTVLSGAGPAESVVFGLQAILADGRTVSLGKAPRAAAGPDPIRFFWGALGTLGVVTRLVLRFVPPARRAVLVRIEGVEPAAALDSLRRLALDAVPVRDVAVEWAPGTEPGTAVMEALLAGPAHEVDHGLGVLTKMAGEGGSYVEEVEPSHPGVSSIGSQEGGAVITRVGWEVAPELVGLLEGSSVEGAGFAARVIWSGLDGAVVRVVPGTGSEEDRVGLEEIARGLLSAGVPIWTRGIYSTEVQRSRLQPLARELLGRTRARLDPAGLLNPQVLK